MDSCYANGYVLVDIGDVWSETTGDDGQPKMVRNTLYLPEGKKPLIFSYDDTNYYPYMLDNGFTYKLILGEDGKVTSWGLDPDGSEVTSRELDAIPALDKFVEDHPDFSPEHPEALALQILEDGPGLGPVAAVGPLAVGGTFRRACTPARSVPPGCRCIPPGSPPCATGASWLEGGDRPETPAETAYILNTSSKKFHLPARRAASPPRSYTGCR